MSQYDHMLEDVLYQIRNEHPQHSMQLAAGSWNREGDDAWL
jgi:hypothetical protein